MRTWPRGRNADYVTRVIKAAQAARWTQVIHAIRAAADKVPSGYSRHLRVYGIAALSSAIERLMCAQTCLRVIYSPHVPKYWHQRQSLLSML